jgi:sugar/nucleoside kinase (ribokinase family)
VQALFIGQTYIDVTFLTDRRRETRGLVLCGVIRRQCRHGGILLRQAVDCSGLIASLADDWLGRMFLDMAAKYEIPIHPRKVASSSLSFIMPRDGRRAIVRCRDSSYLNPFPALDLTGCRVLHVDGHQPDAAIDYAKQCRAAGILTSLDGGGLRSNTDELLAFIDVAIVAERRCEQMRFTATEMLEYLKARGCRIGGVKSGERGLLWYDEEGAVRLMTALLVPQHQILDTNGAGDVFHGAYVYSYLSKPDQTWDEHLRFARAAAAHKIQYLGNESGLPTCADVEAIRRKFGEPP